MLLNNVTLIDRGNRPNIIQRVGLRAFFINDGAYVDPYEISSVTLFKESDTLSPSSILDPATNLVSAVPLMAYGASGESITIGGPNSSNFDPSNYTPGVTASGIYRTGVGQYVIVLDQTLDLSGYDFTNSTQVAASSLSSVDEYVDVWTVKLTSASKFQTIFNDFELHEDTFFTFTEPLLISTSNKLLNKKVRFGENIDIKVSTEVSLQNKDLPKSVQNIFKDSVLSTALVTIKKVNQDPQADGPFAVVTNAAMDITSDNTLVYTWDTNSIVNSSTFGSNKGTYSVQVTYSVLNQIIISPLFYLTVS